MTNKEQAIAAVYDVLIAHNNEDSAHGLAQAVITTYQTTDEFRDLVEAAHDLYRLCPDPEPVSIGFDSPPEYATPVDAALANASWRLKEALAPFTRMRKESTRG